jgi:hypothetical protein
MVNNINNPPFINTDTLIEYLNNLNSRVQRLALARSIHAELAWYILMNEQQGNIPILEVQYLYNELSAVRNIIFNNGDQAFLNDFINLFQYMDFEMQLELQKMNLILN